MPLKIYFEDKAVFIEDKKSFFEKYTVIKAAGGLVKDADENLLLIFRRGKWDLPKGKSEEGESPEVCANREIREETGLSEITLEKPLLVTYHTYTENDKDILKETHWFLYTAPGRQKVLPQVEEDITEIKWVNNKNLQEYTLNTYALVRDVIQSAGFIV